MNITFKVRYNATEYEASIDEIDADLLNLHWRAVSHKHTASVYVVRTSMRPKEHTEHMHRVILGRVLGRELLRSELVDHIDRDGLNNTRENLRLATRSQNNANRGVGKNNKLGVKGVFKDRNKFAAQITTNGNRKYLGAFNTIEEAHAAYVEAAKKHHGDFARGE